MSPGIQEEEYTSFCSNSMSTISFVTCFEAEEYYLTRLKTLIVQYHLSSIIIIQSIIWIATIAATFANSFVKLIRI